VSRRTPDDILVLHAVRVMGYASGARIAARLGMSVEDTQEHLLDAEARGWTTSSSFAGDQGWSLTESGRSTGQQLLAAELDDAGARAAVESVHRQFLPWNDVVAEACTAWQLRELGIGTPGATLSRTTAALHEPAAALAQLEERLTEHLQRFWGYHHRFTAALTSARREPAWITATDRDSCHQVWFELHEDLIATLGLTR
jgi:hypothetical protein